MWRLVAVMCLLMALASPLRAELGGTVVEVVNGHTLVLSDGTKVLLRGIEVPNSQIAKEWLEVYVLERKVVLMHASKAGMGTYLAVPVILHKRDVCGMMLYMGHAKIADKDAAFGKRLVSWRTYQKHAQLLQLGLWAGAAAKTTASAAKAAAAVPAAAVRAVARPRGAGGGVLIGAPIGMGTPLWEKPK